MNWLDDELRSLLRRKQPPEGFTERVLARVEVKPLRLSAPVRRRRTLTGKSWVGWVAGVAACLLLAITLVQHRRDQHERAQAELASQQAAVGLHIARAQLHMALAEARQATEQDWP